MGTTTIRLTDELKSRVAEAADSEGQTAHAFILEAIQMRTAQSEARRGFVGEARSRLDEMDRTGKGVPWDEVRQYMLDRVAGKRPVRPKARKFKA